MTAATPGTIRITRHLPAVAMVWLFRLILASLLASPLVLLLGATGIGHFPEGDALFFRPGGTHLLEALRLSLEPLGALAPSLLWPALLALLTALFAHGALLVALSHTGRPEPGRLCMLVVEAFPALLMVSGLTVLLRAGLLLVGLLTFGVLDDAFAGFEDPRHKDFSRLAYGLVLGGLWAFLGCVQDVSRAAAVRTHSTGWRAWLRGFKLVRQRPFFALIRFAGPFFGSLSLVLLGAWLVDLVSVEQAAEGRAFLAFGVHQAVAFSLVFLRAHWLARALDLAAEPAPVDRG